MMTDDELRQRLNDHEDNFVERKPAGANAQELRQTLSAFSNTLALDRVGILFVGISDKTGAVVGVPDTDSEQKRVRKAAEACYPPIRSFESRVLEVSGLRVVAVMVRGSDERPHFTGLAFVRVGSESVNASADQLDELIASRNDKARAILRMRGLTVSLESRGRRLDDPRPLADVRYRAKGEGKIDFCDAHCVRFTVHAEGLPGWSIVEPLERVEVSYDTTRSRPSLILNA
jgi:hypothetical protein